MKGIQEKIYYRSPMWLRSWLVSAYGYKQYLRRYGGDVNARVKEITSRKALSRENIEAIQVSEFKRIFKYSIENVPYYRKHYTKYAEMVAQAKDLSFLTKLPILTKEIIRCNYVDFLSEVEKPFAIQATSGSTGSSMKFALNKKTYQLAMALLIEHEKRHGVEFRSKRATFNGRMLKKVEDILPPYWVFNKAENQMLFSSYHLSNTTFSDYRSSLENFSPEEIIGYPSVIYELARLYRDNNIIPNLELKCIVTNSETLIDWQRRVIEDVFNTRIYDYYGSVEYVLFASQCEKGSYHIDPTIGMVELIGNDKLEKGVEAEVIATTLTNTAMPLIRYSIGDTAVPLDGYCECNRSTQCLHRITGRLDDTLVATDGRHIGRTGEVFGYFSNIKEAQIIQHEIEWCELIISKIDSVKPIDEIGIISKIREKLGGDMKVSIKIVPEIPKGANGKFRTVLNKINDKNIHENGF